MIQQFTFSTPEKKVQLTVFDEPATFVVYELDRIKDPQRSTSFRSSGERVYRGQSFSVAWSWVVGIFDGLDKQRWPAVPNKLLNAYGPIDLEQVPPTHRRLLWYYVPRGALEAFNARHNTSYGQKK